LAIRQNLRQGVVAQMVRQVSPKAKNNSGGMDFRPAFAGCEAG
jgi:hypothetical protein